MSTSVNVEFVIAGDMFDLKRPSKLEPFKNTITRWREDDKSRRKKQSNTPKHEP